MELMETPIQDLGIIHNNNHLYIKRDDLITFSFGGNKARKAALFFRKIDQGGYDCVVTYGTGSSNHCRVVSNMCAKRGLPCFIISPKGKSDATFNKKMMEMFGAGINMVDVNSVHDTIERKLAELKDSGYKPYFIEGGGHGNLGTEAYVRCYQEIRKFEEEREIYFDYIFLASGTGTTQAGLVCGQIINADVRQIVGISIARENPYGRDVIIGSIKHYLETEGQDIPDKDIQKATVFLDDYVGGGYGTDTPAIQDTVETVLRYHGIPLDATYTGKAFYGMQEYIKRIGIGDSGILFLHTGGTPLFFDALRKR